MSLLTSAIMLAITLAVQCTHLVFRVVVYVIYTFQLMNSSVVWTFHNTW